jgi:hypothetical protein
MALAPSCPAFAVYLADTKDSGMHWPGILREVNRSRKNFPSVFSDRSLEDSDAPSS